ncbi:hypothetical protein OJF2_24920 [Aquisphaera giovannonii]|uniref:Uncharacterized protein n=1 Tax=Aquisphaera giovannonii TaxID=406548 RepID=A0A5B9W113_9BACT|nr:hypothetical protein [Aquisphaera giovannonii]QEH33959.1 hypothetical protein OJF2_24920 [Aquisphaera giovannonii]
MSTASCKLAAAIPADDPHGSINEASRRYGVPTKAIKALIQLRQVSVRKLPGCRPVIRFSDVARAIEAATQGRVA